MRSESIFEGLNPQQKLAVESTEGPVLVLAGAGSGKTRVLTHRVAHLIGGCGIPADSILAVTFTNKAAGEMRERVEKILGPVAEGLWISTFHSTCVRILRRDIGHLGRSRGFVIYNDADSLGVVKEVLRRHSLDPKAHDPRRLRWRIDQWKNAGLLPNHVIEQAQDVDDELYAELYTTYQRLLADAEALDFGDLLLLTVELFRRFPQVLRHYQERWQYVLVDEYQDTNRVQYDLVRMLAAAHNNICVVGDPDQSVYAWRGADVRNILDFERDYDDAVAIKLEQNYRSTQPILSGATAVVENNLGRKEKTMFTERSGGELIECYEASDDREEAAYVVREILERTREQARALSDFAILYRTNAQSRSFEEELLKYDLPYVVVGGVRFYDRLEIKDALAYLRLMINPRDDQALRRILNKPVRGIGKTTLDRAASLAQREACSLLEALERGAHSGELGRSAPKVGTFVALMTTLRSELLGARVDDAIAALLDRTGYLRALEREDTPDAETRVDNLKELLSSARDFHGANAGLIDEDRTEIDLFLDQVALVSDTDGFDQRVERVSLLTAHSAKGLEFAHVFLVGMEEGIFPHASSARSDEGLEEERRLCYVAMTRAMEKLTITCASERRRFGERSFQSPSRFLREIPEKLVEVHRSSRAERARDQRFDDYDQSTDYSYAQEQPGEAGAWQGQRVRHAIFGVGTIVLVIGEGMEQKLKIKFDKVGVKTVMIRFANLEPV